MWTFKIQQKTHIKADQSLCPHNFSLSFHWKKTLKLWFFSTKSLIFIYVLHCWSHQSSWKYTLGFLTFGFSLRSLVACLLWVINSTPSLFSGLFGVLVNSRFLSQIFKEKTWAVYHFVLEFELRALPLDMLRKTPPNQPENCP